MPAVLRVSEKPAYSFHGIVPGQVLSIRQTKCQPQADDGRNSGDQDRPQNLLQTRPQHVLLPQIPQSNQRGRRIGKNRPNEDCPDHGDKHGSHQHDRRQLQYRTRLSRRPISPKSAPSVLRVSEKPAYRFPVSRFGGRPLPALHGVGVCHSPENLR